ncbi:helicase-like protein [Trypanosoma conorhini]|uniref:Helicase-like protein n=1 Tax=Trypanosoma conorhini TaxID=83891 RepID=A0A3R7LHQ9_9TRYP|nr:helicase-like protein [Trypanosoma conorhini]RNF27499.1 helicase-like protein [Trypanosoma conorhini]
MPQAAHTPSDAAYDMPFEPYPVQRDMMQAITTCLQSSSPVIPVAAVEVPTGCGKTLALLSSVLRYQATLELLAPHELEEYMRKRRWKPPAPPPPPPSLLNGESLARNGSCISDDAVNSEEQWGVPHEFFKQFRTKHSKRLRVEMDGTPWKLRQQHETPCCTVFYVTRTHSQVRQTIGELRKLRNLHRLKMNVLGSRERYCINSTVLKARANKTLPVEGNNLGEVCDKLVSLGQCEAVHNYGLLGSRAISYPLCQGRTEKVWDMEDLVAEGVATQSCPYYAARDLVFFACVNFATYQYLLDPLIRHECKMEAALKNHSIVIIDEAHNVPSVCQDALSLEVTLDDLRLVVSEIEPLVTLSASMPTLSYPREFKLTHWTLAQLFALLYDVFHAIVKFVERQEWSAENAHQASQRRFTEEADEDDRHRGPTLSGEALANIIQHCILDHIPFALKTGGVNNRGTSNCLSNATMDSTAMFRQVYGIVMSLGVTFNPFQFSVFSLSIMKRWLLVIRFMLQKPSAFAVSIRDAALDAVSQERVMGRGPALRRSVGFRCLDGSLAFRHLLAATHRVVLASGTIAPFHQLGRELGISLSNMLTYEGSHIVGVHQYRLAALTHTVDASRLHCNYANFRDTSFIDRLVSVVVALIGQVRRGGVLVFLPNYGVMQLVGSRLSSHLRGGAGQQTRVFTEPKEAMEFPSMLDAFRAEASCGAAVLVSVYRAKVGEGMDFADNMTRLVVCVGIPLRPLKSWTVAAQRRYSGEEWYIIDAIRAVNQALGRCLRNGRDFGAMVLLDDRFEQEAFQNRLPKWCAGSLQVHHTPASVVEELAAFFRLMTVPTAAERTRAQQREQQKEGAGGCCTGKLPVANPSHSVAQVDHAPRELPSSGANKQHSQVAALLPFFLAATKKRPRITTCTHEWSCTAVKLLYEGHDTVEEVAAAELRDTLHLLEKEYLKSPVKK